MEMINRLTADALDSSKFVERIKAHERELNEQVMQVREGRPGENREQRRARERAERKAAQRAARVRP